MSSEQNRKFEILSQLALAASRGEDYAASVKTALELTANYVGLDAASFYLWDDNRVVSTSVSYAKSKELADQLNGLEEDLFDKLRSERKLVSAYLTFGGDTPLHTFTLPLRFNNKHFGAVIGMQQGKRSIVAEDTFLETFSAVLTLWYAAANTSGGGESFEQGNLDEVRLKAVLETAVTVNHEVNNPLQAIIGIVQLLLMKHKDELPDDLLEKLKAIEESAAKISNVTRKLMSLTSPKTVDYSNGTKMIDLGGDDESDS